MTPAPNVKSHYFRHGGSYKRLFLEKHLQSCIEKFIPQQTDLFDIKDLLGVMEPYIKRLEVTELLPPTLILVSIIKTLQVLQYRQESVLWKKKYYKRAGLWNPRNQAYQYTCILVAVGLSGILKGKQKLGVTFNSNKLGGIDFTKISKLTMCSA